MNIIATKAVQQKEPREAKDPAYLQKVRALPCCVCSAFGMEQLSPTMAHHVFHDRFSGRRTPDRMAIPLCDGHHQGDRDTSKISVHRNTPEPLSIITLNLEPTPTTAHR